MSGGIFSEIGVEAGLSSSTVRDVAIDSGGNVWAATAYGLTVLRADGSSRTYRVDNSDLIDNRTYSVTVFGGGPALPADAPEDWAGVAGVALDPTGAPLAGIDVEVCVEDLRDEFDGDTPCALDPYRATAVTDDTGRFEITGIRAGSYVVAMAPGGSWTYFTDGSVAARYDAIAGELSELGVFEIG